MNLLLIAIMNLSTGFLAGVLAIPLITKAVGPNGSYGFRFKNSFQSDEAWFAINSYGGKWMLFLSVVILGIGGVFLYAYFADSILLPNSLKTIGVFTPCLLLLCGLQAKIWADKHFPKIDNGQAEDTDSKDVPS